MVAGGGAIEMELSKALRDHSKTIKGKQQLIMSSYAKALEIIPRQLVRSFTVAPQAAMHPLCTHPLLCVAAARHGAIRYDTLPVSCWCCC